jgi:hypothetical protein
LKITAQLLFKGHNKETNTSEIISKEIHLSYDFPSSVNSTFLMGLEIIMPVQTKKISSSYYYMID